MDGESWVRAGCIFTFLNEKLGDGGRVEGGGGVKINGTWLTSRWCTPGEKFALFVYDSGKMRGKECRPVVLFQCTARGPKIPRAAATFVSYGQHETLATQRTFTRGDD